MAGKSDIFEADLLKLIFNGTSIPGIADNAVSGTLTNLFVALHTADPQAGTTEGSSQSVNEATYAGYTRVAVARNSTAWSIVTDASGITKASPISAIQFPQATGGTNVITHFSVGTSLTGTGKILYAGAVAPTISVSLGVQPVLGTGTSIAED